jgi:hypothetical protein
MIEHLALQIELHNAVRDYPNGNLLFAYALVDEVTPANTVVKIIFNKDIDAVLETVPMEPDGSYDFALALTRALLRAKIGD